MLRKKWFIALILILIAGCKGTDTNAPRIVRAGFLKKAYTVEEAVRVNATVASSIPAIISYRWSVNNVVIPDIDADALPPDYFHKNDKILCEITVRDSLGKESEPYKVSPLTIKNSPPKITYADFVQVDSIYKGANLSVDLEYEDIDDDDITIRYNWYMGNKLISTDSILDGQLLEAGKNVKVELVPYDGDTTGENFEITRPVLIQNLPPNIINTPSPVFNKNILTCKINAEDPDGDPISYSIEEGPSGMTIDNSGNISWRIPEQMNDTTYKVIVKVTDSKGAGNKIQIPLKVSKE